MAESVQFEKEEEGTAHLQHFGVSLGHDQSPSRIGTGQEGLAAKHRPPLSPHVSLTFLQHTSPWETSAIISFSPLASSQPVAGFPPCPAQLTSVTFPNVFFHGPKYPVIMPTIIKRTIRTIAAITMVLSDKPWPLDVILKKLKILHLGPFAEACSFPATDLSGGAPCLASLIIASVYEYPITFGCIAAC